MRMAIIQGEDTPDIGDLDVVEVLRIWKDLYREKKGLLKSQVQGHEHREEYRIPCVR